MTQCVRADRRIEAHLAKVLVQLPSNRSARQPLRVFVQEQRLAPGIRIVPSRLEVRILLGQLDVGLDRADGVSAQRYEAFLLTFAADFHRAARKIKIADLERDQLAHPDTGRVERLEHRAVAAAQHIAVARRREQTLDLFDRDRFGQTLGLPGCADERHRVRRGVARTKRPLVEAAQRSNLPCHGGGGVFLLGEVLKEATDQLCVRVADDARERLGSDAPGHTGCLASTHLVGLGRGVRVDARFGHQVLDVLTQVRAVAPGGVRAEPAFIDQVAAEAVCNRK